MSFRVQTKNTSGGPELFRKQREIGYFACRSASGRHAIVFDELINSERKRIQKSNCLCFPNIRLARLIVNLWPYY